MRLSAAFVIPILLATGGQAAHAEPPEEKVADSWAGCVGPWGQAARARQPEENVYVVECRMTTTSPDGKTETQWGPCMTVSEGRKAMIDDVTQTPLVTGIMMKKGQECPRVTVFDEGTKIELTVFRESGGWATLDATIETSKLGHVKTKILQSGGQRHCPCSETRSVRVIESAALGDEFAVVLGGTSKEPTERKIEFVVYTPEMPRPWDKEAARKVSWISRLLLVLLRALAAST